jgi:antitoxin ParD1/3/4
MATMNISLTDDLKQFVDEQVAAKSYTSTSEYLRELIRRQRDVEQFRKLIDEGAQSPVVGAFDKTYFDGLRARVKSRSRGATATRSRRTSLK